MRRVPWVRIGAALADGATAAELGRIAGCSRRQTGRLLVLLRLTNTLVAEVGPRGRKRWRLVGPFVAPTGGRWSAEEMEILRTETSTRAAARLGISVRTVSRERRRLGIAPAEESRSCTICGAAFRCRTTSGQRACSADCSAALDSRRDDDEDRRRRRREAARRHYLDRTLAQAAAALERDRK